MGTKENYNIFSLFLLSLLSPYYNPQQIKTMQATVVTAKRRFAVTGFFHR